MSNCCANSASVLSPRTAAKATFALKAGVWFRRFVIVSPGLQPFWLLSGRNSTYPDVQISKASSLRTRPLYGAEHRAYGCRTAVGVHAHGIGCPRGIHAQECL